MSDDLFRDGLERVVDALDSAGAEWAVTGSFALAHYGIIRATHDVDLKVMVAPHDPVFAKVRDALGPGFRAIDETTFRYREAVDIELYPLDGKIDRDSFARRRRARLFPASDREYWLVSPEDLVVSKLRKFVRWQDLKQADDLRRLAVARRADLDWAYIEARFAEHEGFLEVWDRWVEGKGLPHKGRPPREQ